MASGDGGGLDSVGGDGNHVAGSNRYGADKKMTRKTSINEEGDKMRKVPVETCWKGVTVTLNDTKVDLPSVTTTKLQYMLTRNYDNLSQDLQGKGYTLEKICKENEAFLLLKVPGPENLEEKQTELGEYIRKRSKKIREDELEDIDADMLREHSENLLSQDVALFHSKLAKIVFVVGSEDKVEKTLHMLKKNLKRIQSKSKRRLTRLSTSVANYKLLKSVGCIKSCEGKISRLMESITEKDSGLYIDGTDEERDLCDKEMSRMLTDKVKRCQTKEIAKEKALLYFTPDVQEYVREKLSEECIQVVWDVIKPQSIFYILIVSQDDEINKKGKKLILGSVGSIKLSEDDVDNKKIQELVSKYENKRLLKFESECYATDDILQQIQALKNMEGFRRSQKGLNDEESISEKDFLIDHGLFSLLQAEEAKDYLMDQMERSQIFDLKYHLKEKGDKKIMMLRMRTKTPGDLDYAWSKINECFREQDYANTSAALTKHPKWLGLKKQHKGKWIAFDTELDDFVIWTTSDISDIVENVIMSILNDTCTPLCLDAERYSYLCSLGKQEIQKIETKNHVHIDMNERNTCVFVGAAKDVGKATEEFHRLLGNIKVSKMENIEEVSNFFFKDLDVEDTFKKEVGKDCCYFASRMVKHAAPHHVSNWVDHTERNFYICLMAGDPVNVTADAIVCPTDSSLYPIGVGEDMLLQGGADEMKEDCFSYIKEILNNRQLKTGEMYISKETGSLQFQYVAYLVVEADNAHDHVASHISLQKWIHDLLVLLDKMEVQSVVLPINLLDSYLSTTTSRIADALNSLKGKLQHLCEAYVCVKNLDDLHNATQILDQALKTIPKFDFSCLLRSSDDCDGEKRSSPIKISVDIGSLVSKRVDVVVNTIGPEKDLSLGAVSNSILERTGEIIQKEIDEKPQLKFGDAVSTSSGNLQSCKKICHVVLPGWCPCTDFSLRIVKKAMWQCLLFADKQRYSEIAFPALGTGKLSYPYFQLAKTMFECVDEFGCEHLDTSIKKVIFVVFGGDKDAKKCFQIAEELHKSPSQVSLKWPPQILEWRKSIYRGVVKIQTVGVDEDQFKTHGCEAVVKFRSLAVAIREAPDGSDFRKNGYEYGWVENEACIEINYAVDFDKKESLKEALLKIFEIGKIKRITSLAICMIDQTDGEKCLRINEQMEAVKESFLEYASKSKSYINIIRLLLRMETHDKLITRSIEKREAEKKKYNIKRIFDSIVQGRIPLPDWKIVKPSKIQTPESVVLLTVVGQNKYVEKAVEKVRDFEDSLKKQQSKMSCQWYYGMQSDAGVFSYTANSALSESVCCKLNIAVFLGKADLRLEPTADDVPYFYDLRKRTCRSRLSETEMKLICSDDKEGKNGESTVTEFKIFKEITANINKSLIHERSLPDVIQTLKSYPDITVKSGIHKDKPDMLIAKNFEMLKDVNKDLMMHFFPQTVDNHEEKSLEDNSIEFVIERDMDKLTYEALEFFYKNEDGWKSLNPIWREGKLLANSNVGKHVSDSEFINQKMEKVQTMNKEDIFVKSNMENIKSTLESQSEIFHSTDGSKITLVGENYNSFQTLKQKIQILLGEVKVDKRRNRKFVSDTENNKGISTGNEVSIGSDASFSTSARLPTGANVRSEFSTTANVRSEFLTTEGIRVKVYSASILSLSVDCIVNAANEQLSHGAGVAAVIADAAGYELEKEGRDYIYQYGPIPVGSCCSTTAGKLNNYHCVIHTVGPRWSDYRDKEECRGVLKRSVYVCLEKASQHNLTSIGIPSISAGIFGVPKEICATEYYNAVAEFSKKYGGQSSLQEVHFIDKDDSMVNLIRSVFTKCFSGDVSNFSTSKYSANTGTTASFTKSGFGDNLGTSTRRSHSSHSSVDHSVFVSKTNKKVYVHKKDICSIAVDAIVCPQDREFSGRGQIARSLYKKAGTDYQNEMNKIEFRPLMSQTKVFETHGSLPFRFVFHTVAPRWDMKKNALFENNMQKAIDGIFTCCVAENVKSLALPLLGLSSDGIDQPLSIFGKVLVKKLKEVFDSNISFPGEVHIVCIEETGHGIKHIKEILQRDSFFQEESSTESTTASPPSSPSSSLGQTLHGGSVSEDCCICMDTCTNPKRLACGHIFCKDCIDMQFTYKPTCPACGKVFGKLTGNQPNGTITFRRHGTSLPGYSHDGTIEVMYNIYSGTQGDEHPNPGRFFEGIRRSGLLPDNEEGRKVAKLLNVAFSRKLVFTIGRSRTTEKEGVVTWNDIHHKTRREGGTERFGYPDPSYISRVLDELSVKGVTEESADDPNEFKEYSSVFSRR